MAALIATALRLASLSRAAVLAVACVVAGLQPAAAERIANKVAVFSGLDKITGRITTFDVYVDETVQFGALQVTPRACFTRSQDEAPKTDSFVEVDEITLNREIRRIFSGWMFADSPGLNAVEHPVYDVWLKDCKSDSTVAPPAG
ncbi:DUF2155 domain-containing protein [Aureimonas sp. AU12]|uniref:DUF2155 domain-containing protein n=1 Tax=Aureimonas sp. AU12 TaxID=1638161 RepID=UPI0007822771|nr:DUF2155 domain-containing protein [Aureimonas sp. AU12]